MSQVLIHNFFADLLRSTQILFSNIIFNPTYIKQYEFNIQNRTFKYATNDYKTNYDLPTALVKLNDFQYSFGERPNVIQWTTLSNINQIPIIYDQNSRNTIYLQEEQIQVSIDMIINCESALQCKDIDFRVKRFLPLNKYIQLLEFTSFLEISPEILLSLGINYHMGDITNLFTRLNQNTGDVEYCYSVRYKPLIRLESASSSIDSSQRTFPVTLSLIYQIQMPIWICGEEGRKDIVNINVDFVKFGNEPISTNSCRPLFGRSRKFTTNKTITKRNLIISEINDYNFILDESNKNVSFEIKFDKKDFIISPDFQFNIFDKFERIHENIKPLRVDTDLNKVIFLFSEDYFNLNFKPSLTEPIIIQFIELIK